MIRHSKDYRDTGSYSTNWDASGQANGIYLALMKAGVIIKTERDDDGEVELLINFF